MLYHLSVIYSNQIELIFESEIILIENTTVAVVRLANGLDIDLPSYGTIDSAGVDLMAAIDKPYVINAGERGLIATGIAIALPSGFEAQIRPRSGLALKYGITCLNAPGTIDADYRGEIGVILINHGNEKFTIKRGQRIAQLVIAPVAKLTWNEVNQLPDSNRGIAGFGSTGI